MAVDLSAAFDTVDHSILITVLRERFGITEMALSWFESYLHPQYCKVNVGTTYSKNIELVCSVQQGLCAGPILFMVYASTIESVVVSQTSDHEEEQSSQVNESDVEDRAMPVTLHGFADDHGLKTHLQLNLDKLKKIVFPLWKLKQLKLQCGWTRTA